jgi:hypothetical protein
MYLNLWTTTPDYLLFSSPIILATTLPEESSPPTPYMYPGVYQNDATSLWVIPYDCDGSNKLYYWGSSGDSSFVTLDTSYSPSLYTITGLVPGTTYSMFSSPDGITADTKYTTRFSMQQITTGVPASVFVINDSSVGVHIPDYDQAMNLQVITPSGISQTIPAQGQGAMTVVSNLVPGLTFSLVSTSSGSGYQYGSFRPFCSNIVSPYQVPPPQKSTYTTQPNNSMTMIIIILIILYLVMKHR